MRKEIERCEVDDGRVGQKGYGYDPHPAQHDKNSNVCGHDVYEASPCDTDPKNAYTVPDCAYKGYDEYTWPEGRADVRDLPCDLHGLNEGDSGKRQERKTGE